MTALLRIYDKVTAPSGVSTGLSVAAAASSLYTVYGCMRYINPVVFLVSACAGAALAVLARKYLAHNREVKTPGERNTIYSTCALVVGFTSLKDSLLAEKIIAFVARAFAFFKRHPHPCNIVYAPAVGFSLAMLCFQVKDSRSS